jgi:hypothetical protein
VPDDSGSTVEREQPPENGDIDGESGIFVKVENLQPAPRPPTNSEISEPTTSLPKATDDVPEASSSRCDVCGKNSSETQPHDLTAFPLKCSRRSLRVALASWEALYDCPELSQMTRSPANSVHLCESCMGLFEELDEKETEAKRCVAKIREAIASWGKEESQETAEVFNVDPLVARARDTSTHVLCSDLVQVKVESDASLLDEDNLGERDAAAVLDFLMGEPMDIPSRTRRGGHHFFREGEDREGY